MMLRGKGDADWAELVQSWRRTQDEMRERTVMRPLRPLPRFVAGADAAFSRDKQWIYAVAVVYDREEERIVEVVRAKRKVEFPYIPGFLSFREGPAVIEAIGKLQHSFGAICFDGQGYAHSRRCGLATHVAVTLDVPGVGAAKSRLIGTWKEPGAKAGSFSPLMDGEEQIGIVLRTRDGTRPMFVSVGHKMDLESARELVLGCCVGYRMPEPTRQADTEVAKMKREEHDSDD